MSESTSPPITDSDRQQLAQLDERIASTDQQLQEVLELRRQLEQYQHDSMTGLKRRESGLPQAARASRQSGGAVVLVDVDNLKAHNNVSMTRGDWAIRVASSVLGWCCRASDTVIRWGGDELVVIITAGSPSAVDGDAALNVADLVSERIRESVTQRSEGQVAVSCGWAPFAGAEAVTTVIAQIVSAVDSAGQMVRDEKRRKRESAQSAEHITPGPGALAHLRSPEYSELLASWHTGALQPERLGLLVAAAKRSGRNLSIEVLGAEVCVMEIRENVRAQRILAGTSSAAEEREQLQRCDELRTRAWRVAHGEPESKPRELIADLAALVSLTSRRG